MIGFKLLYRVVNTYAEKSLAAYVKRNAYQKVVPASVSPQIVNFENESIHKILENCTAFHGHVVPSPNSCVELGVRQIDSSHVEKCNCSNTCKIFQKLWSPPIVPMLSNGDTFSGTQEHGRKYGPAVKENLLEIENLCTSKTPVKNVNNLKHKLQCSSDMELIQVMVHSSVLIFQSRMNFTKLMRIFDLECCKRYPNWDLEQQLFVADIWFHLHAGKYCAYNSCVLTSMLKTLEELTTSQLVHMLFITNVRRTANPLVMLKIEKIVKEKVQAFSLEEIAVIAIAYFKTSTKISSDIVISEMIDRLTRTLPNVDEIVITCILKSLRYSHRYENEEKVITLMNKALEHCIWKNDFRIAVHSSLLVLNHNMYMPALLDAIVRDMCKFQNVRLKDIERVLLVATKFNHLQSSTHRNVFEFVQIECQSEKRGQEIKSFPHSYMSCMLFLAYAGVFNYEELNKVFSKAFYDALETRSSYDFLRDLATLDYIVEMDAPEYKGNRLEIGKRFQVFQQRRYSNADQKSFRKLISGDLILLLKEILNEKISTIHLLPYMDDPVFLLIFNNNGQLCKPCEKFLNQVSKGHFAKPTNNLSWIVIWPLMKTDQRTSTEGLSGFSMVKERHFQKLGYHVIKVPIDVHRNVEKSRTFLLASLKRFLRKS